MKRSLSATLVVVLAVSCASGPMHGSAPTASPVRAVAEPRWKERLDESYAFTEVRGDRRAVLAEIARLHGALLKSDAAISGPPFVLRPADGAVPAAEPVRVCFPLDASHGAPEGFAVDVLPASLVVYAHVTGRYDSDVIDPSGVLAFAAKMSWQVVGPMREIFLVPPRDAAADALVREIQIPTSP